MNGDAPRGFLALWNGISGPAIEAEYEAWHTFEHVPERVALPGFVGARRYVGLPDQTTIPTPPHYFTLYALDRLDALRTRQYQDVVDAPTPWSARMRGVLTDFCREPCELICHHGHSDAAHVATLRLRLLTPAALALLNRTLQQLVVSGHAVQALAGRRDAQSAHPLDPQVQAQRGEDVVVLLFHVRAEWLSEATRHLRDVLANQVEWRGPAWRYMQQSAISHSAVTRVPYGRPTPREDLRQRFQSGD